MEIKINESFNRQKRQLIIRWANGDEDVFDEPISNINLVRGLMNRAWFEGREETREELSADWDPWES